MGLTKCQHGHGVAPELNLGPDERTSFINPYVVKKRAGSSGGAVY
jgi:hypothetical protein